MLKRIINLCSIYFTCICAPLLLISLAAEGDKILSPERFLLILVFAFTASFGTAVKECKDVGRGLGYTVHAVCYIGGFLFFILLPADMKFVTTVVGMLIYVLGYVGISLMRASAERKNVSKVQGTAAKEKTQKPQSEKKRKKNAEYKSLFSDSSED